MFIDYRIQDIDGGFFEKFGSLLRQKTDSVEEKIKVPLAPLHESDSDPDLVLRTIEEHEHDSGTETLQDTDSEPEDLSSKTEEIIEECTGWNVSIPNSF